jgi:hypothetical protein
VSRRIAVERFDAVVTLDFSAARTFQTLHDEATLRVLDFIDSHPRYQNRYVGERVLAHVDDRLNAARHENPRVLSRNPR